MVDLPSLAKADSLVEQPVTTTSKQAAEHVLILMPQLQFLQELAHEIQRIMIAPLVLHPLAEYSVTKNVQNAVMVQIMIEHYVAMLMLFYLLIQESESVSLGMLMLCLVHLHWIVESATLTAQAATASILTIA